MSKTGENIYKRKDGRWEARYPKGREQGKTKYGYVYGKTREDARRKREAATGEIKETEKHTQTFEHFALEWLSSVRPQLKPSSFSKYNNILQKKLIPAFGSKEITHLTRGDISSYCQMLLDSGSPGGGRLSPGTVNGILSVLKNVFRYAQREKGADTQDISDIFIRQTQKPLKILSLSEQKKLDEYLLAHPSLPNIGILLCMYTGLRIGEICALKWSNISLGGPHLCVNQTMQRIQLSESTEKKTKVILQRPKSDCSVRIVPLPDKLAQRLLPLQKSGDAFFLTGNAFHFMEPRVLTNHFKMVLSACGLPDINFHVLRHTFATRCVELDFDVKSLSEILGHSRVSFTMSRYVHPSMELKQKNMNRLSELLPEDILADGASEILSGSGLQNKQSS